MALVTICTLYQTINIALVILMSKGWMYIRQVLTRGDLSAITAMMGVLYLSYSAYFVTCQIPSMSSVMGFWMECLYIFLLVYLVKQYITSRKVLYSMIIHFEFEADRGAILDSLRMKNRMLK